MIHFEIVDFEENCTVKYTFKDVGDGGSLTVGSSPISGYNSPGTPLPLSEIEGTVFKNSGINITSGFAWKQTHSTSMPITGTVTDGKPDVKVFILTNLNGEILPGSEYTDTAANFSTGIHYPVPSLQGNYYICISSSQGGSWSCYDPPRFVIDSI